ncbi:hypothetical protein [Shimazuella kribbensis]|nr:hypothetical protein [Shimazuella kribbensis]
MQMMRLVLEKVQDMNERIDGIDESIKQLPTRRSDRVPAIDRKVEFSL